MNVDLVVSMKDEGSWLSIKDRLSFYAEEADIRFDIGQPLVDTKGERGVSLRVSQHLAAKLHDIVTKAGMVGLELWVKPIPPQLDQEEQKIQKKLFPGGDTTLEEKKPKDRELPSSRTEYSMSKEEYDAWLKGQGRRATYSEE